MPTQTAPVEDSVAKVNNELAVGSDLEFQKRWWRFEKFIWVLFTLIVVLNLLGGFGRGWLAKARMSAEDGSLTLTYERIARFSSPSRLQVELGPGTIRDGKIELWVSDSLVKALGNQRVIPEPVSSQVGTGGILYTFAAAGVPASVEFSLEPSSLGRQELTLRVPGKSPVTSKIFVMP
jgi:hypothetical protein